MGIEVYGPKEWIFTIWKPAAVSDSYYALLTVISRSTFHLLCWVHHSIWIHVPSSISARTLTCNYTLIQPYRWGIAESKEGMDILQRKTSVGSMKVLRLKYIFLISTQKLEAIIRKDTAPLCLGKARLLPSPWLALLESCKLEIILVHVRNKD